MKTWKLIKTEAEAEAANAALERLLALSAPSQEERDELELVTLLIETYEKEHVQMPLPDPVEAILFRMEQQHLSRRDLQQYIGSASKVSEVLHRKIPLSLSMIRKLHAGLGIPAEVLLQEPKGSDANLELERYPFKDMFRAGYFKGFFHGPLAVAQLHQHELLQSFFENFQPSELTLCGGQGETGDDLARRAWQCHIVRHLEGEAMPPFSDDSLTEDFLTSVVRLSAYESGAVWAGELLRQKGIRLVVERPLPGMRMDGEAWLMAKANPVIALTLRQDRQDVFWFSLLHQLAHLRLYTAKMARAGGPLNGDMTPKAGQQLERQVQRMANDAIMPEADWEKEKAALTRSSDPATLQRIANRHQVGAAVLAGRIQRETGDETRFAECIKPVRYLLNQG